MRKAHIEEPAHLVGALDHDAEQEEVPGFVAVDGGVGDAELGVAFLLHELAGLGQAIARKRALGQSAKAVVEGVDLMPELGRQDRA